jgi:hypothetical protein
MGCRHFRFGLNPFAGKRFSDRRHLLALRQSDRHGSW